MNDYKEVEVSPERCAKWAEKLERLSQKLIGKGVLDQAQMVYLCSVLMGEFVVRLETQALASPFPITPGVA